MRDVVAKRAAADDEEAVGRLRREAALLERLVHPGVVELVDLDGGGDNDSDSGFVELRTVAVTGPPITSLTAAGADAVARAVAALATTVADLHDLGVAHTRIGAEHVLLDDAGRPVLCGLADAVATTPDQRPAADDVAALGRLLRQLLPPAALSSLRGSPVPFDELARAATAEAWTARPTARAFADALWSAVDPSRPQPDAATAGTRPAARRRWIVGGAGAAVLAVVALAVGLAPARHPGSGHPGRGHAGRGPTAAAPARTSAPGPNTVEIDGHRYAVGEAGDQVVSGRFDCRQTTAAVLTTSGGLWVFDELAAPGHDTAARHLRDADASATLVATDDDGDGCDELTLQPDAGDEITISPRESR